MVKVYAEGTNVEEKNIHLEGECQFAEGGIEKDGKPSFTISVRQQKGDSYEIYLLFKDMWEFDEFIASLREQIRE